MLSAAMAVVGFTSGAFAETVTTKTVVQQEEVPGVNKVNLTVFDLDKNGILSRKEIGEYLFRTFDTDGNHNIDNLEFKKKMFITLIPMEKETTTILDFDDDGRPDDVQHTEESFVQLSQLGRFDDNKDGLSANEFINKGYEELDDDEDRQINLEEWEEAYKELVSAPVNEPERYQN